ncbi:MAG: aliphatic nitrilase [Betaproteobacteria bacterium RBG_16_66_20]|nr:MAG: aliphatic nitrilase [Betaproteobacteria bacterium RBG_16_66_20]
MAVEYPRFTAAAVQAAPVWMNTAATVAKAVDLIRQAAARGAELVAFPEVYVPAYPYWNWLMTPFEGSRFFRELYQQSILVPGEETQRLCEAARLARCHVVIGVNERSPISMGTIFNTNLVIGSDGQLLGVHRKLVPTFAEKLTWGFGDGSSIRTYQTDVGRIGTLACGENTNTLARYALLAQGEQIHVANYPGFPFTSRYSMTEAIRIRAASHAFEGKVFVIVSSSVVTEGIVEATCATDTQRQQMRERPASISVIYGPDGQPACEPLIDVEGIVYAIIDLEREIELKQFHDIVGHYNRFDVFDLRLNRRQIRPLSSPEDAPFGESLPAESADVVATPAGGQPVN